MGMKQRTLQNDRFYDSRERKLAERGMERNHYVWHGDQIDKQRKRQGALGARDQRLEIAKSQHAEMVKFESDRKTTRVLSMEA
jgi:hypothetical protein